MTRHVGKIASTGQRCVLAMLQLPERPDHALVVVTDVLPPRYEQALMSILESKEGQSEEMLAKVLMRRIMPDTGRDVFTSLHEGRFLQAVPVTNILMLPTPNMPFPLEQILQGMNKHVPASNTPRYADAEVNKFNPHLTNQSADKKEQATLTAKNLLIEADMLEAEVVKKREQAYAIAPHLKPTAKPVDNAFYNQNNVSSNFDYQYSDAEKAEERTLDVPKVKPPKTVAKTPRKKVTSKAV